MSPPPTTTSNHVHADIHDGNQKYDFGTFYASKVFIDAPKQRAVLFGWVNYGCAGTDCECGADPLAPAPPSDLSPSCTPSPLCSKT